MQCPKCHLQMEQIQFLEIEVDRCTGCEGIWFDAQERQKLAEMDGSEAIDTGDPKVGKEYNKVDDIDCPRCKTRMIRMVDPQQPHIWFESCTVCGGAYFDAGEFTDYKQHTWGDVLKRMFARERK